MIIDYLISFSTLDPISLPATLFTLFSSFLSSPISFPIDDDSDLQYVDLLKNPERFTGYAGPSAHRIWNSIYQENCFKEEASTYKSLLTQGAGAAESCLEKRVFYRVISGLHASINVHVSAEYLIEGTTIGVIWGM